MIHAYRTFFVNPAIMDKRVVIVTGSSGFLGSAICVDLSRDYDVIGLDCRRPSAALQRTAPGVEWQTLDIADGSDVRAFFDGLAQRRRAAAFVLHMAAFYHFGRYWRPEYDRVNIRGLRNVLAGACRTGTQRFLFAGSIAALPPPPPGGVLSEQSSPGMTTAYTRSKTIGESLLAEYSERMPTVALRIAGVFSDWCELPPLYSLIRLWCETKILGRLIPGRGLSGFPYIHRRNLARCVRQIIRRHEHLKPSEILFASPPGCTTHNDLFGVIRRACDPEADIRPVFISPALARCFLFVRNRVKAMRGHKRYERRWMMDFVDTPLVVDTTYTQKQLQWTPGPELSILNRMPVLMQRFTHQRYTWEQRNVRRNDGGYVYGFDGP